MSGCEVLYKNTSYTRNMLTSDKCDSENGLTLFNGQYFYSLGIKTNRVNKFSCCVVIMLCCVVITRTKCMH